MPQVAKIALPGNNALTETDPDKFALYVDQLVDYVLIKEKASATVNVPNGTTLISHGLDYVPFCLVWAEITSGTWRKLFSTPIFSGGTDAWFEVDSTNLELHNSTASAMNFSYHIFYDNIT